MSKDFVIKFRSANYYVKNGTIYRYDVTSDVEQATRFTRYDAYNVGNHTRLDYDIIKLRPMITDLEMVENILIDGNCENIACKWCPLKRKKCKHGEPKGLLKMAKKYKKEHKDDK